MKRFSVILFLFITAFAQAQKFEASVSKSKMALNERFKLTFTLNSSGNSFTPPDLKDFNVYGGPNQSSSMQFINGNMSQSISYSYVLSPKKVGTFTIGKASIKAGGKTVSSQPISIEVVKGNVATAPQANNNNSSKGSNKNIFARTSVSKSKAYEGEGIVVTHKVYTRLSLRGFQDVTFPSYNGFFAKDVPSKSQIDLGREVIDGVAYHVAELKQTIIFAQRTGKIKIDAAQIECVVREKAKRSRYNSLWDDFFGGGYKDAIYKLESNPITINAIPLPEPRPTNFSGAVGKFNFSTNINNENVKANEAVNLTVTVSGKGNIELLDDFKINFPEDVETYEPKISEQFNANGSGVSGTKTYDYTIIPRYAGEFPVSPADFNYFDPQKKEYVNIPAPEFVLKVAKGEGSNESSPMTSVVSKEDVKMIGSDIRYIKTNNITLIKRGQHFFGSLPFLLSLLAPLVLLGLAFAYRKRQKDLNKDTVLLKSKQANKVAKKRLSIAKKHVVANETDAFYEEITKALYGYISNKLNIAASDLSKENIKSELTKKNIANELTERLIKTIESGEMARYAPSAVTGSIQSFYEETESLITQLEKELA